MNKKVMYAVITVVILAVGVMLFFNKDASAKEKANWEYLAVSAYAGEADSVAQLNKLGGEGWELVVIQHPADQGRPFYYIFKRSKNK